MITQQQADYLLDLPKHITEQNQYLMAKNYSPYIPIDDRIYMGSKSDDEFTFFLEINQSSKNRLKMTLHFQEEDSSIGLLRVDFGGIHRNPEDVTDGVPQVFRPYAGMWIEDSHIHYYVEGYKPLNWAIPLQNDDTFPIKDFTGSDQIRDIILAFATKINLKTQLKITFQTTII